MSISLKDFLEIYHKDIDFIAVYNPNYDEKTNSDDYFCYDCNDYEEEEQYNEAIRLLIDANAVITEMFILNEKLHLDLKVEKELSYRTFYHIHHPIWNIA